jgi:hypothetical protein
LNQFFFALAISSCGSRRSPWEFPFSPRFYQTAITLFFALPLAVLAIASAAAGIRRVAVRRRGVTGRGGES